MLNILCFLAFLAVTCGHLTRGFPKAMNVGLIGVIFGQFLKEVGIFS